MNSFFIDFRTVSGSLRNVELLKILHTLFPSLKPTVAPIVIGPVQPDVFPPIVIEDPTHKTTTLKPHVHTDHDVIAEPTTEIHQTTEDHLKLPNEDINNGKTAIFSRTVEKFE